MSEKPLKHIDNRALAVYAVLLFVAVGIALKLFYIQLVEGNHYRQLAHKYSIKTVHIQAQRGNIYSSDDKLLAISVPKYAVFFDPVAPSDKIFRSEIDGLARGLAHYTSLTAAQWKKKLVTARNKGRRYVPIAKNLSFKQFDRIRQLPVFRHGRFKGGFLYQMQTVREYPFGEMLRRTIGRANERIKYGLEAAFDKYLSGKPGERLMQKISGKAWKPVNDFNEKEPVQGKDVVSSIDMRFQDLAYGELLQQLNKYKADHGTVVVMDVHTGKIKAMVNLGRTADGNYFEKRNYAVAERYEPGSVFKTFTFLTLLEDGKIKTTDTYHLDGNKWKYLDRTITDAHEDKPVDYTPEEALAHSSNIVTVQLADRYYRDNPAAFTRGLARLGIGRKTGIRIPGEAEPLVPDPSDKNWKGYKLGMMAFGYGVELTPLQILTVYNAIANNGVLVRPCLVDEIKEGSRTVKKFEPEIIDRSIAGKQNLDTIRKFLRSVVTHGTAVNVNSPYLHIAGKTGTTQTDYWTGNTQYIASFAGFFPYENPKYSMIVVIHKPDKSIGYYGNAVAGTVFRKIAEQINGMMPDTIHLAQILRQNGQK